MFPQQDGFREIKSFCLLYYLVYLKCFVTLKNKKIKTKKQRHKAMLGTENRWKSNGFASAHPEEKGKGLGLLPL
jgi:hypothetical protein